MKVEIRIKGAGGSARGNGDKFTDNFSESVDTRPPRFYAYSVGGTPATVKSRFFICPWNVRILPEIREMAVLNLDRWPAHVEKLRDTNKIYLGLAVVFVYTLVKVSVFRSYIHAMSLRRPLQYFRNLWLSPLRNVPGPKLYAFSSFPITYKGLIGQRT